MIGEKFDFFYFITGKQHLGVIIGNEKNLSDLIVEVS